jgi:hypothetical protein
MLASKGDSAFIGIEHLPEEGGAIPHEVRAGRRINLNETADRA